MPKQTPTVAEILRQHVQADQSINYVARRAKIGYASLHGFVTEASDLRLEVAQRLIDYYGLVLVPASGKPAAPRSKARRKR